ncbi:hypothetical protein [Pseudochryseolinea flava]|uniref:Uncharacterized protein n=1 Tax=Pseudochryseolinea flava TaxID=2059302 RepID=A0A364XWL9_9BACT|nr:hypothetical protein [Pseudochryseolinea flava]RAV97800.1 hypothetical protein DQQ10_26880 [Pseudochryseolinea flava]
MKCINLVIILVFFTALFAIMLFGSTLFIRHNIETDTTHDDWIYCGTKNAYDDVKACLFAISLIN